MIDHYAWSGGREAMLRFGPATGPVVVIALPLFEEANRVRAFAVAICRALAKRGVASVLPDLPGQGESLVATQDVMLTDLQTAFAAAAATFVDPHVVALRSGALLAVHADSKSSWCFSPVGSGVDVVRQLQRTLHFSRSDGPSLFDVAMAAPSDKVVEVAGNRLSAGLLRDLVHAVATATPPYREVRLASETAAAAAKYPGTALWHRAEPDNDPALAASLANDIADWIATCGG